jgi:hypothetical protein
MALHLKASSCCHEPKPALSHERDLPLSHALVCQRSIWVYDSNLSAIHAVQQLLWQLQVWRHVQLILQQLKVKQTS